MTSHPLMTPWQLGQNLVAARKGRKLSQADMGAYLALSQSRVSHLEAHPQEMSLQQVLDWCAALDLELTLGRKPNEFELSDAE